jgi:hypothetical protein
LPNGEYVSNQKKFSTYNMLSMALKRDQVVNYGATTTLLLECFVCNGGELKAGMVESRGLCKEKQFKIWREELIKKGWINYTLGDYSRHTPGNKLIKYINREKLSHDEVATTRELYRVSRKIDETRTSLEEKNKELEERVSLLEKTVADVINEYDPPATKEKVDRRLKVVREKSI